jgi:hypothetical protein
MYGFASALVPTEIHARRNDFPDHIELTLVSFDRDGKEITRRTTSYRADDQVRRLSWSRGEHRYRTCAICYRPSLATVGHSCRFCMGGGVDEREEAERAHLDSLRNTGPAGSPDQSWVLCRECIGLSSYDHGIRINLTPWPEERSPNGQEP